MYFNFGSACTPFYFSRSLPTKCPAVYFMSRASLIKELRLIHNIVATLITRNINVSNLYFVLTSNMSLKRLIIYIWFGFHDL